MSPGVASALEMSLVFGIVLAVAIWQLVSVRRSIAADRRRAKDEEGA